MDKKHYVKTSVEDNEFIILQNLAIKNNMSISKYINSLIRPILIREYYDEYIPDNKIINEKVSTKTKHINIKLSEEEYNIIKNKAGKKSLSEYIRSAALKGNKTIKVEVYDDDIVDLERKVQPQIDRLFNIIKALKLQKLLHDAQYNKLEELIQGIYDNLKYTAKTVTKNRTALKNRELKQLDKRCKKAMSDNADNLAVFEMD